ncbi:hypothetical protein ACFY7C_09250 [Streptomyces sp. NPDC012769]|uniref:hypothetical protein n=1 Tax=Streptomyces sp. NPDC012769 TaxID=3364848 RepID=UPI0036BCCB4C
MHPDIHLTLHALTAAELHHAAATAASATPLRVQLGWTLVEFGLRLAAPGPRTAHAAA